MIEGRLAKLNAVEKVARIQRDGGVDPSAAHFLFEFENVDDEPPGRGQSEPITVVWDQLITERGAQTMQRLPKGVPRFVLGDTTPKEVHNLVAPHFAPQRQIAQERQRFAPPKRGRRLTFIIHQRRNAQNPEAKRRAGDN